ncbi:hypothetical protein SAICODRAFT_197560 [Saitoella complicata NRRL Y-17804]|uniref:uncharacterized protein n=1 Tax=Saitoella complicata (strain BCRC 22490 / CBS 7301 / JCM 7358 / NBRC 10748 / NRRL Y-17804) TaxID=698492 RepID=UPI000867BD56|nr:uncharacterized protein SAICODRAFT_197560 [Saitoella complicata NRRL Y-17804]ODQ54979.1 hypothetical protein SAICODRAFT_197560 [Saitoella complicata NRRL Y-17804]
MAVMSKITFVITLLLALATIYTSAAPVASSVASSAVTKTTATATSSKAVPSSSVSRSSASASASASVSADPWLTINTPGYGGSITSCSQILISWISANLPSEKTELDLVSTTTSNVYVIDSEVDFSKSGSLKYTVQVPADNYYLLASPAGLNGVTAYSGFFNVSTGSSTSCLVSDSTTPTMSNIVSSNTTSSSTSSSSGAVASVKASTSAAQKVSAKVAQQGIAAFAAIILAIALI